MVLIVSIGDLHFKKETPAITDLVVSKILEKIEIIRPDIVVILGDMLDSHEKIDMLTLIKTTKFMKAITGVKSKANLPVAVFMIVGNHERADATTFLTENSSLYTFKDIPNVHVVDRVIPINVEIVNSTETMRFVFVPYVAPGQFHKALDTLEHKITTPGHIPLSIFCHQEFKGCPLIGGRKSRLGDDWDEKLPLCISGHIHSMQRLQSNIIYAGTPYQQSFSDTSKKGIIISEYMPGKSPVVNFLELNIVHKKIVKLSPAELPNFIPEDGVETQVDIVGTDEEIAQLMNSGIITRMKTRNIKICLSTIQPPNPMNPNNKSIRELLIDMIANDPIERSVFSRIFPNLAVNKPQPSFIPEVVVPSLAESMKSASEIGLTQKIDPAAFYAAIGQNRVTSSINAIYAGPLLNQTGKANVQSFESFVPLPAPILGPQIPLSGPTAPVISNAPIKPAQENMEKQLFGTFTSATASPPAFGMPVSPPPVKTATMSTMNNTDLLASLMSSAQTEKNNKPQTLLGVIQGLPTPSAFK